MKGVIYIGAHRFENYKRWIEQGAKDILSFEPIVANFEYIITNYPQYMTYHLALANCRGEMNMYTDPKYGFLSSSLLKPLLHKEDYPEISFDGIEKVSVDRLDWIIYDREEFDYLHMAAQGMELEVFKGAEESLKYIQTIECQVYKKELYQGCPLVGDIVNHLHDFRIISYRKKGENWGWATFTRI